MKNEVFLVIAYNAIQDVLNKNKIVNVNLGSEAARNLLTEQMMIKIIERVSINKLDYDQLKEMFKWEMI